MLLLVTSVYDSLITKLASNLKMKYLYVTNFPRQLVITNFYYFYTMERYIGE